MSPIYQELMPKKFAAVRNDSGTPILRKSVSEYNLSTKGQKDMKRNFKQIFAKLTREKKKKGEKREIRERKEEDSENYEDMDF